MAAHPKEEDAALAARLLRGSVDLHVHCAPDVVPRAQDAWDYAEAAAAAGMAAVGLKDHTTTTRGRCAMLNRRYPEGPHFFACIVLNPQVGGLNPAAVEAALQSGVEMVYFPTWSAEHHIRCLGPTTTPVPHPSHGFEPICILKEDGSLVPEVPGIIELLARHDAILATGHLSPRESLVLLEAAVAAGVQRMVVTHASESVPAMSIEDQRRCVSLGAWIEHSFLAVTPCCPGRVDLEHVCAQIRTIGVEHCILSTDFGQVANGAPVAGFAHYLAQLLDHGFDEEAIHTMIARNPAQLLRLPKRTD